MKSTIVGVAATMPGGKSRSVAIGPLETAVRNRAEGKAFWVKAVFPF